jgi:CheY-like chemotaxis protein
MRALALRAHLKGLELAYHVHPDVPPVLVADPHRLRQVLTNLVGNAIKFTERGEVVVEVKCGPGGDGHWPTAEADERSAISDQPAALELHVSVRDTGIGVSPDKQAAVFQAFEQGDRSITRRYGGTGLGLTISQRLVEMMGGRIWMESVEGVGSTFYFTIRCEVPAQPHARHLVTPAALRDLSVLVVDDNATNRRILNEILTHWQMRPTTVDGGIAALGCLMHAAAAGRPFPLVLIDVHMPEMDGFTLAEHIKRIPALAGATIMMLSSADLSGEAARCRALGVAGFLTKPIHQSELLDAIRVALGDAAREPVSQRARPAARAASHRLHILLAEDNPVNQRLTVRLLEKRGHTVVVANNGREALAALAREPVDLVLMDVQMPEMDGLEATAEIRRREAAISRQPSAVSHQSSAIPHPSSLVAHVPIIALTAHAMKGDDRRCLAAGMDGYISKPIKPDELFAAIDELARATAPQAAYPPTVADTDRVSPGAALASA